LKREEVTKDGETWRSAERRERPWTSSIESVPDKSDSRVACIDCRVVLEGVEVGEVERDNTARTRE